MTLAERVPYYNTTRTRTAWLAAANFLTAVGYSKGGVFFSVASFAGCQLFSSLLPPSSPSSIHLAKLWLQLWPNPGQAITEKAAAAGWMDCAICSLTIVLSLSSCSHRWTPYSLWTTIRPQIKLRAPLSMCLNEDKNVSLCRCVETYPILTGLLACLSPLPSRMSSIC